MYTYSVETKCIKNNYHECICKSLESLFLIIEFDNIPCWNFAKIKTNILSAKSKKINFCAFHLIAELF